MKKILLSVAMLCMALGGRAETQEVCQGWPADYDGVMLQGFWWDGYEDAKWVNLEAKAGELSQYFDLIWIPNSGTVGGNYEGPQGKSMGYDPCYWLHHNSYFGTEQELIHMIQTYKALGVGIIEDVVINHKKGVQDWLDFANELAVVGPTTGKAYTVKWNNETASEICCTDDCNYSPDGNYHTTGSYDTGDDFPGFRDLDHTSATTQKNVKVYLDFLLNELGYAGFRYDLVKGYGAGFIQAYNNSAMPRFSVGEYWDNQTNIQNWIMGTGNTSAAFDFPLKYKLNEAISGGDYSALQWKSFTYDPNFSRYSVTFADNHDSGREDHSRLVNNWSAANAFLLASPGTPCIWLPHYNADPLNIGNMIRARKACGIKNTNCRVNSYATDNNRGYVMESFGSEGSLYVLLGEAVYTQTVPSNYKLVAEGNAYKFYSTKDDFAYVTVSPNSQSFTEDELDVTLTPVNASNGAWYKIGENGNQIPLTGTTTLRIGVDIPCNLNQDVTIFYGATGGDNDEFTGSSTYTKRNAYNDPSVGEDAVSVFFETDAREVYFYAWGGDLSMAWNPEPNMTLMGMNNAGKLVYKWIYDGSLTNLPTGLLFIADGNQTADFDFVNNGYYTATGLSYHLGSNTVYYDNSVSQWDKVYYYAWDNQGRQNAEWPGEEVTTKDDRGYYQVSVEGYTSIIFNNPDAQGLKQTEDLTIEDGKVYKLEANTVAFDNSNTQWSKVYYYAFTDDEVQKTKWPGEEIATTNAEGNYEVTLQKEYTNVIFNDGNGGIVGVNQTEDLKADGKTHTLSTNTVYFNKTDTNWGENEVRYYAFNVLNGNDRSNMSWPGEVINTKTSDGRYEVTLPEGYNYVIFNNCNEDDGGTVGVTKTADLKVENGKTYTISSLPSVRSVVLLGIFNSWSKENVLEESPENTWTYLLNLTNTTGDTEIKLLVDGNEWIGYTPVEKEAPDGWIVQASSNDNILLKNSTTNYKTYQVTISWTPSTNITNGWKVKVEGVEPRNIYTVAGSSVILGSNWDIGDTNNDMQLNPAGTEYTLTRQAYMGAGTSFEFKVVKNRNWNTAYPGTNYVFTNESAGLYDLIFKFNPSTNEVSIEKSTKTELVITDGEPFAANSNFTIGTAKYQRAFKNNWGTLCLPFEIKKSYEGVTFYRLSSVDVINKVMTFGAVNTVDAGVPVVYKAKDGVALNIEETDAAVTGTAQSSDVNNTGWTLHGTFTNRTGLNANSGEYLYYIASNQFWQGINTNIATYRAWFTSSDNTLGSSASGAPFRIEVGEEQDIQVVEQHDGTVKVYYDLQGRRLGNARKGLVIVNGKLIFVK